MEALGGGWDAVRGTDFLASEHPGSCLRGSGGGLSLSLFFFLNQILTSLLPGVKPCRSD